MPSSSSSLSCLLGSRNGARLPHALDSRALPPATAALCVARRGFFAGLDDSRVHRLRRSGMTFNRPRGRDTFSVAFESRLRLVPLTQMSDLYGPIDVSLLTAANADDPTSSTGNPLEQRKYMAGDAQMRRVVEQKRKSEASIREKLDWHVLVVDPIELHMAAAPVPYPNPHPVYYRDWPTTSSASAPGAAAAHRPRRPSSCVLEQREVVGFGTETDTEVRAARAEECGTSTGEHASLSTPADTPLPSSSAFFYAGRERHHLQQSGDTTLLPGAAVRSTTLCIPNPASTPTAPLPTSTHTIRQHFHTAVCVDPDIHHDRFHREEAQVEMISAYRNILYEAAELGLAASGGAHGSLHRTSASQAASPYVADVVRVPALCHYSCGPRFFHELGKLNQQAIIKGFHRLSNEAKEVLIENRCFTVEVYVPPQLLEMFEKAFLEEAWEVPLSTLNPGRTALYPGLAPPRTLLEYDGWIGKRPELIEAVETKGRSLLRGTKYALDGTPIEEKEVLASLRVFGAREEQQRMLEGERQTAADHLGAPLQPTVAPLRPGLQEEVPQSESSAGGNKVD